MSWNTVKIADLATVKSGGGAPQNADDFSDNGIPFVRAGSMIKLLSGQAEDSLELLQPEIAKSHRLQLFPAKTILFAKSGMSATKGYIYQLKQPAYVVNHLAALIPHTESDAAYLQHVLQFKSPTSLIKDEAYPSIRLGDIEEMLIPAPKESKERERIAAILDQADSLRRARRQSIEKLNSLSQSIFYEMFGDPNSNPHAYPMGTIRDLVREVKYGTSKKAHIEPEGFPVLRMGNLTYQGSLDLDDLKYVHLEDKEIEKYTAQKGDILFNRTNSKELVGKTAVFDEDEPYAIAGYLVRARTNKKANPYYISAYLNSSHGKAVLLNMCKNIVGMANINAQEFQDIKILMPPVELQNEYQEKLQLIEKQKCVQKIALNEHETLFLSLQQRAFRGEL